MPQAEAIVFVVDDDPSMREALGSLIRSTGVKVETFASAQEFLTRARADLPFYSLHLLFDKHHGEQAELVDALAERVQMLGGVSVAMSHDVAETTRITRPPRGRERVTDQLTRLLQVHEFVLAEARGMAREAAEAGDDGTNDLLVSELIRTNEMQVWFVAEHLADAEEHS